MEDLTFQDFSIAECVSALNSAKDVVVESIHPDYLDGLEVIKQDSLEQGGDYNLSSFFTRGVRNDTFRIRYYKSGAVSDFIPVLPLNSIDGITNSYLNGDPMNPIAYIFNNTLYIRPILTTPNNTMEWSGVEFFGHDVNEIVADMDGYVLGEDSTVTIGLSGFVNGIVLDIAESNLWKADNKLNRSNLAYTRGMELVQRFNAQV